MKPMKNRYQIVVTETVDRYIEFESEQDYTKTQLKRIARDVVDENLMTIEDENRITFYPNECCGRLYDVRKNGKDM